MKKLNLQITPEFKKYFWKQFKVLRKNLTPFAIYMSICVVIMWSLNDFKHRSQWHHMDMQYAFMLTTVLTITGMVRDYMLHQDKKY